MIGSWLSSRSQNYNCTSDDLTARASFGLYKLYTYGVLPTSDQRGLCDTGRRYTFQDRAKHTSSLRPIIAFPTSLYKLQEKTDGTYDIVKK